MGNFMFKRFNVNFLSVLKMKHSRMILGIINSRLLMA